MYHLGGDWKARVMEIIRVYFEQNPSDWSSSSRFIHRKLGDVPREVCEFATDRFERRAWRLKNMKAVAQELGTQISNTFIHIEVEPEPAAEPAAARRAQSEPRKPHGGPDQERRLAVMRWGVEECKQEGLDLTLANLGFAVASKPPYKIEKAAGTPGQYIFSGVEIRDYMKETFKENFQEGFLFNNTEGSEKDTEKKEWKVAYERPPSSLLADEALLAAIRRMHDEGVPKGSARVTATKLRQTQAVGREFLLGDLQRQINKLKKEDLLQHTEGDKNTRGKIELTEKGRLRSFGHSV